MPSHEARPAGPFVRQAHASGGLQCTPSNHHNNNPHNEKMGASSDVHVSPQARRRQQRSKAGSSSVTMMMVVTMMMMKNKLLSAALAGLLLIAVAHAAPTPPGHQQQQQQQQQRQRHHDVLQQQQRVLRPSAVAPANAIETGVGHFSEWSRATKKQFLIDWQEGRSSQWIIVQGNEGGDMDSMTAALTWAYHLAHASENTTHPVKAIALLQTETDALDLRPENSLALRNSLMSTGHSDLLTIDELPEDPDTLSMDIKGIVLVDHASPLRKWANAPILSLFDHHEDAGAGRDASPRIFEKVASCTTLVARQMLDELERLPHEYHLAHELLELILGAIAIDAGGLDDATPQDRTTAQRILARSNWRRRDLDDVMDDLDDELSVAKKDLDSLSVRDLLRRDWKGDLVDTLSPLTPSVMLGFSSIPYSLDQQIAKTEFEALFDWFVIEAAWTARVGSDISIALNKYKVHDPHTNRKRKVREIVVVVRSDVRIDQEQADDLFRTVNRAIEREPTLRARPWHRADELGRRQMVWTHERQDGGRKVIRPIIERAVREWDHTHFRPGDPGHDGEHDGKRHRIDM